MKAQFFSVLYDHIAGFHEWGKNHPSNLDECQTRQNDNHCNNSASRPPVLTHSNRILTKCCVVRHYGSAWGKGLRIGQSAIFGYQLYYIIWKKAELHSRSHTVWLQWVMLKSELFSSSHGVMNKQVVYFLWDVINLLRGTWSFCDLVQFHAAVMRVAIWAWEKRPLSMHPCLRLLWKWIPGDISYGWFPNYQPLHN